MYGSTGADRLWLPRKRHSKARIYWSAVASEGDCCWSTKFNSTRCCHWLFGWTVAVQSVRFTHQRILSSSIYVHSAGRNQQVYQDYFEIFMKLICAFFNYSSIFATKNLTVQADNPVTVTQAVLAGQQVNNVYVVNVNETFSISVMPVDRITGLQLGQVQWGNWTWSASVNLYSLSQFNRPGAIIASTLSRTVINHAAKTVTVTNLAINGTGMYVLSIRLVSSNNVHTIDLLSNGILVKSSDGKFRLTHSTGMANCSSSQTHWWQTWVNCPVISPLLATTMHSMLVVSLNCNEPWSTTICWALECRSPAILFY